MREAIAAKLKAENDIDAKYKPINDLVVENRKISGTGAAEIGDSIVYVGNLILDFDYEMMSRVLKIPDEKFRDKVKKTIRYKKRKAKN